jgi:hypothetical protein
VGETINRLIEALNDGFSSLVTLAGQGFDSAAALLESEPYLSAAVLGGIFVVWLFHKKDPSAPE